MRKLEQLVGKEMAEAVADFINTCDDERLTEFVEQMAVEHRTLQQVFTRLCVAWFEHLASLTEHQYDARNEASVKLAKKFIEATGDKYDRYLPTI